MVQVKERVLEIVKEPKFRDVDELTYEQLTDPDYRLKQVAKDAGIDESQILICSKCHHCR